MNPKVTHRYWPVLHLVNTMRWLVRIGSPSEYHYTSDKQLNEQWERLLDFYQMLDIVKVLFNGLVSILTGASVNLQAYPQIVLNVNINLQERWSVIHKALSPLYCCPYYIWGEMGVWDEQLIVDFYLWIVLTEADWGWRVIIISQSRPEMTPKTWGFCQHQIWNLFLSLCSREIHKNIWEFKSLAFREINVYLLKSF